MDIRRRLLPIKKKSSSGSTTSGSYTVNLNGQWEKTSVVTNPDTSLYDGVYRSTSNYNVNSGVATMYITIKDCSSFKLYIRSYAESYSDFVMVSQLDKTITGSTSVSDSTLVKAHTRGNQQSGAAISNYTLVEFTGISSGEHTITIVYRKDSSLHKGDDRGYVLIYKQVEGSEGGGDVDIEGNNVITYTSSDGKVVTPYSATVSVFGATITSNTYTNGVGIILFDGDVTSIGDKAFYYCSSLKSINIPSNVTSIKMYAFRGCIKLTSITIPDRVNQIIDYAFADCASLTSVTIPNSVTLIGNNVFTGCTSLANFQGKFASNDGRCLIVEGVLIAFAPAGLTAYTIPASVTSIGGDTFYNCRSLTSVTIPNSVTSIGGYAFSLCTSLDVVYCKSTTPPTLGSNVFSSNASNRKIYVPMESVDAYKTASDWSSYASYIEGYNFSGGSD